nr:hypothetical protein MACL_00001917 [Theileria orientalis]
MGGVYSDLHVYFYSKKTENYNGTGYNVTVKQEKYPGCSNYVKFTHEIAFSKDIDGRSYNVILYDGPDKSSEGNPVFGYYYPNDSNQVVHKEILDEEYRKKYRNRKIRFRIGNEKVDMYGGKQELGNNKNYRFIFTPKGKESVLDKVIMNHVRVISKNFLLMKKKANEKQPPGQMCKQNEDNNNTALLVEFIDSCNSKTCLKRMDTKGHWWSQETLNYNDDATLHSLLSKIKEGFKTDKVHILLDKKEPYLGVDKVVPTNGTKAKHVEVYYLKASGKEDKEPFLIVLDPDGKSEKQKNECYHFVEPKPPEPPTTKPPVKPKVERPPDEPKPLPVWLIEILDNTKYRYIFIPKGDESILDRLCKGSSDNKCKTKLEEYYELSSSSKLTHNNRIDPYYLTSVNKHFFDGIMVYLSTDNKLYPKTLCEEAKYNTDIHNSKIQIRRKDKNGYWWSEEKVEYNSDTTLIEQLTKFDKEVKEKECVTVILDNKKDYLGASVKTEGSKIVCKKYTHEFTSAHNPVFLFARTVTAITELKDVNSFKSKRVEVYYLNAGGKDDTQPFLIVFFTNGVEAQNNKKAYHFKNTYDFKDWVEFNKGKSDGLEKKVEKIEQYCACLSNIITVRWYAHEILIGQEPDPPKPEVPPSPTRPEEKRPPDEPDPPPIWLIVGCVAAGVVLIVTSVVVYGIYWYNTTIKLLT